MKKMLRASIQDASSLGLRMACRATPKLISTTNMMITKYIMSIIYVHPEEGEKEGNKTGQEH